MKPKTANEWNREHGVTVAELYREAAQYVYEEYIAFNEGDLRIQLKEWGIDD